LCYDVHHENGSSSCSDGTRSEEGVGSEVEANGRANQRVRSPRSCRIAEEIQVRASQPCPGSAPKSLRRRKLLSEDSLAISFQVYDEAGVLPSGFGSSQGVFNRLASRHFKDSQALALSRKDKLDDVAMSILAPRYRSGRLLFAKIDDDSYIRYRTGGFIP
jgi:hypothetical protein